MVLENILPIREIIGWVEDNKKELVLALLILLGGAGYWYYTRIYTVGINARAHGALVELLEDVKKAQENPELWEDVELAGQTGARQYSSSSLATYFIQLQSHALLMQGKLDEALTTANEASSYAPLAPIFDIKYARMQLSSNDDATHQKGLESLKAFAEDKDNIARDEALYYLGLYYWNKDNKSEAKKYWQTLKQSFSDQNLGGSPWVELAERKLQVIAHL